MEGKVMTFVELINYASEARNEFEEGQKEKHCKKDEEIRSIIKAIIDNVKKYSAVQVKIHAGVLYIKCGSEKNDKKIQKIKDITLADIKEAIDRIPALYAEMPDCKRNPIYVTFRCSETDSEE
ncbi:MAG: hypothetical protein HFJ57_00245 [Clostridia bacterium]|nr:hypothetical protein [Clostridia bacterium]